jgi:hypothetical protein
MMLSAGSSAQYSRVTLIPAKDTLELQEVPEDFFPFDRSSLYQILSFKSNPSKVDILQVENSFLAWEDCNLNVYRWQGDQWVNTYKYNNYGYFCDGYPLEWKGNLHLLGGNGLVNYHTDLLIFDESLGSWEFVPTKFQPLDYNTPFVGLTDQGAFSLFGKKFNLRNGLDEPVTYGYYLDLSSMTWLEIQFEFKSSVDKSLLTDLLPVSMDTQDYLLIKATKGWLIFDKSEHTLAQLDSEVLPLDTPTLWAVKENTLTWKNQGQPIQGVDLNQIAPKATLLAEGEIVPVQQEKVRFLQLQNILITVFFVGLVVILVIRLYIKPKATPKAATVVTQEEELVIEDSSPIEENNGADTLWGKILLSDGKIFSTAQLDEFLDIQNVNPENRKARRSRIIKSFNERAVSEFGKEIIFRERDPLDKRFFRFRIQIR